MASSKQHTPLPAGARPAEFRLPELEGGVASLGTLVSQGPVVLAFFKVSCPVCQMTLPYLDRIQAGGKLAVYSISQNDARDTREFNQRFGVKLPTLLDPEDDGFQVSNAFGISMVPTMFLIGSNGTVERVTQGWNKSDIASLGALGGVNPFGPQDSVPEWKAG